MKLIAKRPCSFGGKQFFIGDEIPAELVIDPKCQEKRGVLVCADAQGQPSPDKSAKQTVTIKVPVDEGELELEVTESGIQHVFSVLTAKANEAEPIINQMEEGDALILLHMADSRKAIKAAAEARAKAISEAGEQ